MYNRLVEIENQYEKPSARSKTSMVVENEKYIDLAKNNDQTKSYEIGRIIPNSSRNNVIQEEDS